MADKTKTSAAGSKTTLKTSRPSTVTASSSRTKNVVKEKSVPRSNFSKKNTTILEQPGLPEFDAEARQIAYSKFLRDMLEECVTDEKIEREETQIDMQMTLLAERFQKTMNQLDKTSKRLKDISFVVEQKRLHDLRSGDCSKFYEMTDKAKAEAILQDLYEKELAHLDKINLKNVDFGYNKQSGHEQLLDAVNDAIDGLAQIKKESNLDMEKFKEYEHSQTLIEDMEKDRCDLESLKADFEAKFPQLSEKLLKEASEKIAKMIENDDYNDDKIDNDEGDD